MNKFVALPEDWMRGELEKVDVDLNGRLNSPATWNGSVFAELKDFRQESAAFDRGEFRITADKGIAAVQSAEIAQGRNEFHLRGTAELPRDIHDLGRAPATFELAGVLPDLRPVTASLPQRLSGSAQINGKIDIKNGKLEANLNASAGSVSFADGRIDKLSATFTASKILAAGDTRPAAGPASGAAASAQTSARR